MYFNIMYQIKKPAQKNLQIICNFMYYPFSNEKEHLSGSPLTYSEKLAEPDVTQAVYQNCSLAELIAAIVHDAFERISSKIDNNMEPYGQQENGEANDDHIVFRRSANCASNVSKVSVSDLSDLSDLSSDEC